MKEVNVDIKPDATRTAADASFNDASFLAAVPAAINGLALGNAGLASLLLRLASGWPPARPLSGFLAAVAIVMLAIYVAKALSAPAAFRADADSPQSASTLGAFAMAVSVVGSLSVPLAGAPPAAALTLVLAAAAGQAVQAANFLRLVRRDCAKGGWPQPTPYWNTALMRSRGSEVSRERWDSALCEISMAHGPSMAQAWPKHGPHGSCGH